jgi:hypothetical protein
MTDAIVRIAGAAILVAILICAYLVYRHRRRRTKRLASELLHGYFQSNLPVVQLGQRTREIASQQFIGSEDFYALAVSAFHNAADENLGQQTHSLEDERNLLRLLADLKTEFGLTDRYRIEGWKAGRE